MVHCSGFFSGRPAQKILSHGRKRPPEKMIVLELAHPVRALSGNHSVSRGIPRPAAGTTRSLAGKILRHPYRVFKNRLQLFAIFASKARAEANVIEFAIFCCKGPSSSEPTSSVGRFLESAVFEFADLESAALSSELFPRAQRKPADNAVPRCECVLIFTIPVRSPRDMYSQSSRLATTPFPSAGCAFPASTFSGRGQVSACGCESMMRS